MFTGIVETKALVKRFKSDERIARLEIVAPELDFNDLAEGQSIAVNGCCLTLVDRPTSHELRFDISTETLLRTNLGGLKEGAIVNIERAMRLNDRLDGHLVSGHIDSTGVVRTLGEHLGGWVFEVDCPISFSSLVIPKGSICINGVSLTINMIENNLDSHCLTLGMILIPTTLSKSNLGGLQVASKVNLEFDLVGKYVLRSSMRD